MTNRGRTEAPPRRPRQSCGRLVGFSVFTLVLVSVLGAGFAGLAYWQGPAGDKATSYRSLTLGLPMQPSTALVLIARANGYFADEGLPLTVKDYPSGKRAMAEGLFTGAADVVVASDTPVVFNALEERAFSILATVFHADNVNRIIARKDRDIKTPADLRGKRVATQRASAVHYYLHLFLLDRGLTEDDVELVFLKAEDLPKALAEGSIDAFSMREPYIGMAAKALGENAVVFAAPGIYLQTDQLIARSGLVKTHPREIATLLHALTRAERFIKQNPDRSIDIVAEQVGASRSRVAKSWPTLTPAVALQQPLLLRLENQARWAAAHVPGSSYPNFLDFVEEGPLKSADPDAVTIGARSEAARQAGR